MNIMDWTEQDVKDTLPKREADSHKGTFGTALLLAGLLQKDTTAGSYV